MPVVLDVPVAQDSRQLICGHIVNAESLNTSLFWSFFKASEVKLMFLLKIVILTINYRVLNIQIHCCLLSTP